MPRLKPQEVAAAMPKPSRSPKQLANDARLRAAKGTQFYVKKNLLGPDDAEPPQTRIDISTTGPAEATHAGIDIIDPSKMVSKAENEMYMNELVEIQIESDDDPNAPLFVHSGHNGDPQYIMRGVTQSIKRKYLYSLVAAKQVRLVCSFGKDQNGKEFNRLVGAGRMTHRVVVVNDTARGRADYLKWIAQA